MPFRSTPVPSSVLGCPWIRRRAWAETPPPAPLAPVPSSAQLAWQEDELTLFTHFGMNTFTGRSTGLGTEDPKLFNPTDLDTRQWVRVARETGFKGILLTAKHHDGFCLWPTATTEHSVKNSEWRDGHGDVVRELLTPAGKAGSSSASIVHPGTAASRTTTPTGGLQPPLSRRSSTELLSNYGPI